MNVGRGRGWRGIEVEIGTETTTENETEYQIDLFESARVQGSLTVVEKIYHLICLLRIDREGVTNTLLVTVPTETKTEIEMIADVAHLLHMTPMLGIDHLRRHKEEMNEHSLPQRSICRLMLVVERVREKLGGRSLGEVQVVEADLELVPDMDQEEGKETGVDMAIKEDHLQDRMAGLVVAVVALAVTGDQERSKDR